MNRESVNRSDELDSVLAARYLGVSKSRFWIHVREGRLTPSSREPSSWKFRHSDLDNLQNYYDESSRYRRVAGVVYLVVATLGMLITLIFAFNCWSASAVNRIVFCVSGSCLGVGFRGLWLAAMPLPKPELEYKFFYWVFAIVQGVAAFVIVSLVEELRCSLMFYAASGVLTFILGFLVHPDFWPLPQWMRTRT